MSSIGGVSGISPLSYLGDHGLKEADVWAKLGQKDPIPSSWIQEFRVFLESQDESFLTKRIDEPGGNQRKKTLLYDAIVYGHVIAVQEILAVATKKNYLKEVVDRPILLSQTQYISAFSIACQSGNVDIVNLFLDTVGSDINLHNPDLMTKLPLYGAVQHNHRNVVQAVLSHPSSQGRIPELLQLNNPDGAGNVLHLACDRGHEDIVNMLLDAAGENVDLHTIASKSNVYPLYIAVFKGHLNVVKALLNHPSSQKRIPELLRATSKEGTRTALQSACIRGHTEIVKVLFKASEEAHLDLYTPGSPSAITIPFFYAAMDDGVSVVQEILRLVPKERIPELLKSHIRLNDKPFGGSSGCTPFHIACQYGRADVAKILLDAAETSVDLHTMTQDQSYPLFRAAINGHENVVQLILSHPSTQGQMQRILQTVNGPVRWTAFDAACKYGRVGVMRLLLNAAGTSLDLLTPPVNGYNPFFAAIADGNLDVVQEFLSHPSAQGKIPQMLLSKVGPDKQTPLYVACAKGNADIIKLLLDAAGTEIDLHIPTNEYYYPLHTAAAFNHVDAVQEILRHPFSRGRMQSILQARSGPHKFTPLHRAISQKNLAIVNLLLDAGGRAGVNLHIHSLQTVYPIYTAVDIGDCAVLNAILHHPSLNGRIQSMLADRNVDGMMETPLHRACQMKNSEMVKALLAAGAPFNALDMNGKLPYDLADNDPEICAAFFYHLTGGEGNTDQFFAEISEKLTFYSKELKKKNAGIDWKDLYSCLQNARNGASALRLPNIPVVPESLFTNQIRKFFNSDFLLPMLQKKITQLKRSIEELASNDNGQEMNQIKNLIEFLHAQFTKEDPQSAMLKILKKQMDKIKELWQVNISRAKTQKIQAFPSFQEEFNGEDIFVLLSGWNMGMQMDLFDDVVGGPNSSKPSSSSSSSSSSTPFINDRKLTPSDSFKFFLGIDDESQIYRYGLYEGKDIRALGVDLDIDYFVDQWTSKVEELGFVDQFIQLIEDKRQLWAEVLGDGAIPLSGDWKTRLDQPGILKDLTEIYKNNGVRLLIHFFAKMKESQEYLPDDISSGAQSIFDYKATHSLTTRQVYERLTPSRAKRSEPSSSSSDSESNPPKRSRLD